MPFCGVCGEEEFEERDGLFYCTACLTQSQDLRLEERENDHIFDSTVGHRIRSVKTNQESDTKTKDLGRPWHTYEGFQIIIKKQVEALIDLGADPILKDIVFRLWCTYLSKCGIAFPADEDNVPLNSKLTMRHREKYPPTLENPIPKAVEMIRRYRRTTGRSGTKAEGKRKTKWTVSSEEFYDSDNPADEDSEDESSDDTSDEEFIHENVEDYYKRRKFKSNKVNTGKACVQWMNMCKTLCFCHIGLMYTNPLTTASDIIRWIGEDKIPYTKAALLLPSEMKFGCYDNKTFVSRHLVRKNKLKYETGRLITFLGLRDIPKNTTREHISKHIMQLELPGELHGLIQSLRESCLKLRSYRLEKVRLYPTYEMNAMAYIITTLDLLFGLDDLTEKKLSTLSEDLISLLNSEQRLFVWEDWVQHRSQKIKQSSFQSTEFDARSVTDVNCFMKSYSCTATGGGKRVEAIEDRKMLQPKTRRALQLPLKQLSEKWKNHSSLEALSSQSLSSDEESIDNDVSSQKSDEVSCQKSNDEEYNPEFQQTLIDDDLVGHCHDNNETETSRLELIRQQVTDPEGSANSFRIKSLAHLIQPKGFWENLKEHYFNKGDDKIKNSVDSVNTAGSSEMRERLSFGHNTKKFEFDKDTAHKHNDGPKKDQVMMLMKEVINVHKCREVGTDWHTKSTNHSISYRWMLQICSELLLCQIEELNIYVNSLKKFLVMEAIKTRDGNCLIKFLRNHLQN